MAHAVRGYDSESDLVQDFVRFLGGRRGASEWRADAVAQEFFYSRGRTNVIASSGGQLLAFEAKLTRWRDALHQAYRNRSSRIALTSSSRRRSRTVSCRTLKTFAPQK